MAYYPSSLLDSAHDIGTTSDKVGQCVLYIVRHAEVAGDKKENIRGLLNEPLDDKGKKNAQQLVDFFKDIDISGIYCDDLKRTYQTALPLAGSKKLTIKIDPELRSWDVGSDLEGEPIEDNRDVIEELRQQPNKVPVGGQSWSEYQKQTEDSLYRYMTMGMDSSPVVVIWHGSSIQVVWALLDELSEPEKYDTIPLMPAGIAGVYLTRFGARLKILTGEGENLDE